MAVHGARWRPVSALLRCEGENRWPLAARSFYGLRSIAKLRDYFLSALVLGKRPSAVASLFWKQTKNVRVRLSLAVHQSDQIYSLQTVCGRLYFRDNFGDITNLPNLFYHQVYNVGPLNGDGVILDVGANIGLAAAWFQHHYPGRPIYCFEPLAENVAMIRLNCPTALVKPFAVGANESRIQLQVDPDSVMASRIPCQWETHAMDCDVISLDEFAAAQSLEQVALAKIDVEGMEVEVLQGAQDILRKTQRIVMETHGPELHAEALVQLQRTGFRVDSEQFGDRTGLIVASQSRIE